MLQSCLAQARPDLLAAGGDHVVVQLHLLAVREGEIAVESGLDRPRPGVRPALPKVDPEQETQDKFPHCLFLALDAVASCTFVCCVSLPPSYL